MYYFFLVVGLIFSSLAWGQTLLWTTNLQSLVVSTPTAYNGNIYVATYRKDVLGFSQEGNFLFRATGDAPFTSSPLVLSNYLYITGLDGTLYSIDAERGTILWKITMPESFSSPIASVNNLLFTGGISNTLYAFTASTGIMKWRVSLKGSVYGRPLVDEQNVYVGDFKGNFYRFDQKGKLAWQTNLGGKIFASPVKWNDFILVGSSTGNLYALKTTGDLIWRISNTRPISASPVIYQNSIIVGGYDGYLSRIEASTGKLLWQTKLSNLIEASPVIGEDKIYVADYSGRLFCADAETGTILWEYNLGSSVRSSPILVNGKIAVITINGLLSVIQVTDNHLTAGPSLNPYLTGKNILSSLEVSSLGETNPEATIQTNQLTPEEVSNFSLVEQPEVTLSNVSHVTNVITNIVYVTNKVTISNVIKIWKQATKAKYVVQVGSFRNRKNSQTLIRKLQKDGWDAFETKVRLYGKTYYRVQVGYFASWEQALEMHKKLKKYGVPTMTVQRK